MTPEHPELDLLHRAADLARVAAPQRDAPQTGQPVGRDQEPLTPQEQRQLADWLAQPEGQRWATRLQRLEAALAAAPAPQPAASVAQRTARDIAYGSVLGLPGVPPPSRSVAAAVARDIALSRALNTVPPAPRSVSDAVVSDLRLAQLLRPAAPASTLPHSVASAVAAGIAGPGSSPGPGATPATVARPGTLAPLYPAHPDVRRQPAAAPLTLVLSLLAALTLLTVSYLWPSLSVGADVFRQLFSGMPATFGLGLALLLGISGLIAFHPSPRWQGAGAGAFALAAALTFPPLYGALGQTGIHVGRDIEVSGHWQGNVVAVAGDIHLAAGSRVDGQVLSVLGDITQEPGASSGAVAALLGRTPQHPGLPQTGSGLATIQLASAMAVRPLLGWLDGGAWVALFWLLTSGITLALWLRGTAARLAARQQAAPLQTLALGTLTLAALLLPAVGLTFAGWLAPALGFGLVLVLVLSLGLAITAADAGRLLVAAASRRAVHSLPATAGVALALALVGLSLLWLPAALLTVLVGGAWGSGTLLLTRRSRQPGLSG